MHLMLGCYTMQDANTMQLTAAKELSYCLSPRPGERITEATATCSIKHVALGSHLTVWGCCRSSKSQHISLRVDDYITAASHSSSTAGGSELHATNLSGLWASLKDAFIHPLVAVLCAEDGRPQPPSVQLLPTELKLPCMRHLPVRRGCNLVTAPLASFGSKLGIVLCLARRRAIWPH